MAPFNPVATFFFFKKTKKRENILQDFAKKTEKHQNIYRKLIYKVIAKCAPSLKPTPTKTRQHQKASEATKRNTRRTPRQPHHLPASKRRRNGWVGAFPRPQNPKKQERGKAPTIDRRIASLASDPTIYKVIAEIDFRSGRHIYLG